MSIPDIAITAPSGPASAPLLVLGPSLGTSTLIWDAAAAELRETFRVAAWDLPGHGVSPAATESFTLAELADGVIARMDELGEKAFFYAGVSVGGGVGLELLLRHPDRVIAAAAICSSAKFGEAAAWNERAALVRQQGTAALVVQSAKRWFAPGSVERHPDVAGALLHALRDADDESYALCAEALAEFDVRDRLDEISTPVLAISGEFDPVTPASFAHAIADGVVAGRAVEVADASHLAPAEQPAAVAALLTDFFTEVTSSKETLA